MVCPPPHSTLTDCMFGSLAVAPFVAGIKACREPQDLIGNLGEKQEEEKKERERKKYIGCCSFVLMCLNIGLSFSCPQSTHKMFFQ